MKRKRSILFYLLMSLFFTQGIFDCGCLYAAVAPAARSAAVETSRHCHSAGKQDTPKKKDCCPACHLTKYALNPGSGEIQSDTVRGIHGVLDSYHTAFLAAEAVLAAPDGHGLRTASGFPRYARSVPFSTPLFLSYGHLLI